MKAESEARLATLKQDYGQRILRLRVLDPAMGSGHFLLRACQFLAEDIATHPYSSESAADGRSDESAVTYWKRRVVECCLYGVDLNPMAVELAELALWLETVAVGRPLTFLAHHVRAGNSLIGARIGELGVLPGEIELRGNELKRQLEEKLALLLAPLEVIRAASSDRLDDVKSKDRLYRALDKARGPFRDVADLWCSTFAQGEHALTETQYQEVLEALGKPRRLAELAASDWFRCAKQTSSRAAGEPTPVSTRSSAIRPTTCSRSGKAGGASPLCVLSSTMSLSIAPPSAGRTFIGLLARIVVDL